MALHLTSCAPMTAKHTPGPWVNHDGLVNGQESRERFRPGTSIDIFDAADWPDGLREEAMANAALIAAAPDLLDAIKGLIDFIEIDGLLMNRDALQIARNAIARAETP